MKYVPGREVRAGIAMRAILIGERFSMHRKRVVEGCDVGGSYFDQAADFYALLKGTA